MKQHRSLERSAEVCKLKKHSWGVTFHWPDGRDELIDGFDSKQEAKACKAKAADIIALQAGQGR